MIDKAAIDPNALHFYRMLKEAGFSAYFVGGSVRDLLLGKHPKDFDIATNATPHQIKRIIPQGRIIGRRFRHVMLERNGGRYEIVTFRGPVVQTDEEIAELDDEPLENQPIAGEEEAASAPTNLPEERGREKRYPDLNQFGNAEQDALRRDFTINALFYDPDADELVDYVEGKLDIDRRIIRSIGDPLVRMEEDPIRILRAIRHKMKLELEYDPALENAMREKSPLLVETSKDRIREEFLKVCNDHSLGAFLQESRKMGLVPHIMPWFETVAEEVWESTAALWDKFKDLPTPERHSADMGLALMMLPLVEPLVLLPYRENLQPGEKNHLPDMKYFLSCEPLRNFYLRNLRISRAQTDHLMRALFYFSRMSGLWLEQGPPRRIIGRLFQHPPAVLAAKMAKLALEMENKAIPDWMQELADYDPAKRRRSPRDRESGPVPRDERNERPRRHSEEDNQDFSESPSEKGPEAPEESEDRRENSRPQRLPPPDKPMVWNGPLHAPVLRPVFSEEPAIRWARKNQTVRAFRPSGIPNQPVDHSLLKSNLVYNYKPEIEGSAARGNEENQERSSGGGAGRNNRRGGRDRDRHNDRRRGRDRGDRDNNDRGRNQERQEFRPSQSETENPPPYVEDEDSIGNIRMPGEQPAALGDYNSQGQEHEDDIDDNIGNRLDAPPTSGHVGINGEGFLPPQRNHGRSHGGGGGQGNNKQRRGRRRGRRNGGPSRGNPPRGHHGNP